MRYDDFVHCLQQKALKSLNRSTLGKPEQRHIEDLISPRYRGPPRRTPRAASAQMMPSDVITAYATDRKVDSIPRVTETFPSIMADDGTYLYRIRSAMREFSGGTVDLVYLPCTFEK